MKLEEALRTSKNGKIYHPKYGIRYTDGWFTKEELFDEEWENIIIDRGEIFELVNNAVTEMYTKTYQTPEVVYVSPKNYIIAETYASKCSYLKEHMTKIVTISTVVGNITLRKSPDLVNDEIIVGLPIRRKNNI